MRGLAAVTIVAYHVAFTAGGWAEPVLSRGWAAVSVFFAISGFVLYRPFAQSLFRGAEPPSLRRYATSRVARIVPAYWLVLGVVVLVGAQSASDAVPSLFFAQNYVPSTIVLEPAWTLTCEVGFYAALPFLALAVARYSAGRPAVAVGLLAALLPIGVVARYAVSSQSEMIMGGLTLVSTLDLFVVGMIAAVASAAGWPSSRLAGLTVMAVSAPFLYASPGTVFRPGLPHIVAETVFAAGCAMVVLGLADGRPARVGWPPVVALGTISYGVYLWHVPVIDATGSIVDLGFVPLLLVVVAATVALATVSWLAVERPTLRLARGRRARPAAPTVDRVDGLSGRPALEPLSSRRGAG